MENSLSHFIQTVPKVELHVHHQGSIRPTTLLQLAQRNRIQLPASNLAELQTWYQFRDFTHFLTIYDLICTCLQTPADIELAAREFLQGQAEQNIVYSELTYTPTRRLNFAEQLAALNQAKLWGEAQLGISMNYIIDIPREVEPHVGALIAQWAINGMNDGVVALGIGGLEIGHPASRYRKAFAMAHEAGLACIPHAGEAVGPASIWDALETTRPVRIGHGVRCLEDPELVEILRQRQIPLEVCPTSNICLKIYDQMANHALPHLIAAGLIVTLNSDDPPMFNTTLTHEYIYTAEVFGFGRETVEQLMFNAIHATRLSAVQQRELEGRFQETKKAHSYE